MKENNRKTRFQEVTELVDVMHPVYGILLKIVCCKLVMKYAEKRKVEKKHGDTWWWNEEVKEAIQQKKVV